VEGRPPRILILTASIGEGHDLPARVLADGIAAEQPDAEVEILDTLSVFSPLIRRVVIDGSRFDSRWGSRMFDLEYRLITDIRPTRRFVGAVLEGPIARPLRRVIEAADPDVVVSTYPGATEALGRLRARGKLRTPTVSAITDLAALLWWAQPGIDLHLITHPESAAEVLEIAPGSRVECVRGLTDPSFYEPLGQAEARRALKLPLDGSLVLVSGGGWAVGDLEGAVDATLAIEGATAVCLCGRNEEVRTELQRRYSDEPRAAILGFTTRMPELMAAADVLVHSTAGLTVLEALMCGCRVISYGWGHAHVRINNEAFVRFGLAEVAATRRELAAALRRALARPRVPDRSFAERPSAASAVLALARLGDHVGDRG
jgi:processive 1,2-diacylglycerol beta-glucosyltransferase